MVGDGEHGEEPSTRVFTRAEVSKIANGIKKINEEQLLSKFDAGIFIKKGIYPEIWKMGEGTLDYLMEHFRRLRDFILETQLKGKGLIIFFN